MDKFVLYNTSRDCYGYYCGSYIFQHAKYGIFHNLERAKGLGLKVYSSHNKAESARLRINFENASPEDIIVRKIED